jgi:hypothetical protein
MPTEAIYGSPEECLMGERQWIINCLDGKRPGGKGKRLVTDTGFGMGQADVVYKIDGRRVAIRIQLEERDLAVTCS